MADSQAEHSTGHGVHVFAGEEWKKPTWQLRHTVASVHVRQPAEHVLHEVVAESYQKPNLQTEQAVELHSAQLAVIPVHSEHVFPFR